MIIILLMESSLMLCAALNHKPRKPSLLASIGKQFPGTIPLLEPVAACSKYYASLAPAASQTGWFGVRLACSAEL